MPRRALRQTSVIIVQTGTREFAKVLEKIVSSGTPPSVYRAEELRLTNAFRTRFPHGKLTIGFLMSKRAQIGEGETVASSLAKFSRQAGVDSAAIAGRGSDMEVFRHAGIDVRPVSDFSRPLIDHEGWLPVAVVEGEGIFNRQYLPVWARGVRAIDDPLMRDHVRFLQVFAAAVLAALTQEKNFAGNPSLLRAELLRILGRAAYENVVAAMGGGFNIDPVALQVMTQLATAQELEVAA